MDKTAKTKAPAVAIFYKTDDTVEEVSPANGRDFTLAEVQKLVGGYVELVRMPGKEYALANEEGLMIGLPPNYNASQAVGMPLVGNVVVCRSTMFK
jgi:hypothetical protein